MDYLLNVHTFSEIVWICDPKEIVKFLIPVIAQSYINRKVLHVIHKPFFMHCSNAGLFQILGLKCSKQNIFKIEQFITSKRPGLNDFCLCFEMEESLASEAWKIKIQEIKFWNFKEQIQISYEISSVWEP